MLISLSDKDSGVCAMKIKEICKYRMISNRLPFLFFKFLRSFFYWIKLWIETIAIIFKTSRNIIFFCKIKNIL